MILGLEAEVLLAHRAPDRESEASRPRPSVHLVDHQASGLNSRIVCDEARGPRRDRVASIFVQQIDRRADAAVVALVHRLRHELADTVADHRESQAGDRTRRAGRCTRSRPTSARAAARRARRRRPGSSRAPTGASRHRGRRSRSPRRAGAARARAARGAGAKAAHAARFACVPAISSRPGTGVPTTSFARSSSRWATKSASETCGVPTPRLVWRFAPSRSTSTATTRWPARVSAAARFADTNVLPTPPLPPPTAMMRAAGRSAGAGVANSLVVVGSVAHPPSARTSSPMPCYCTTSASLLARRARPFPWIETRNGCHSL